MKIEIPSFSGNLNIESFLDWVYEVKKLFNMAYVPQERHVKFVTYKLSREEQSHNGINSKSHGNAKANHP